MPQDGHTAAGDPNSNWAWYEKQKMVAADVKLGFSTADTSSIDAATQKGAAVHTSWDKLGKSVIMNNERIGKSSDFWNNYEQDIRLAKELGMQFMLLFTNLGHRAFSLYH